MASHHKKKIEDTIEMGFDTAHRFVDKITYPLGPIDAIIHGTARGVSNWLLDKHPTPAGGGNSKSTPPNGDKNKNNSSKYTPPNGGNNNGNNKSTSPPDDTSEDNGKENSDNLIEGNFNNNNFKGNTGVNFGPGSGDSNQSRPTPPPPAADSRPRRSRRPTGGVENSDNDIYGDFNSNNFKDNTSVNFGRGGGNNKSAPNPPSTNNNNVRPRRSRRPTDRIENSDNDIYGNYNNNNFKDNDGVNFG